MNESVYKIEAGSHRHRKQAYDYQSGSRDKFGVWN